MFHKHEDRQVEIRSAESLSALTDLADQDLELVTAGKGGGLGGPYSGIGVRPGLGKGAPGLGWFRGVG